MIWDTVALIWRHINEPLGRHVQVSAARIHVSTFRISAKSHMRQVFFSKYRFLASNTKWQRDLTQNDISQTIFGYVLSLKKKYFVLPFNCGLFVRVQFGIVNTGLGYRSARIRNQWPRVYWRVGLTVFKVNYHEKIAHIFVFSVISRYQNNACNWTLSMLNARNRLSFDC